LWQALEFRRAGQVMTERLLYHYPPPRPRPPRGGLARRRQPGPLQLLDHDLEELRRDGQVEGIVATGPALGVQSTHSLRQPVESIVVGELARHEPAALGQLVPDRLAERRPRVLLDCLV